MSNIDDLSRQMLSMPTLGRHFDLGTVYDAVRDATIPGYTFWNESDLKNVKTDRKAYTEFSIIASDKLTDKFEELKVNGSLQVSILSGMIKLSGSANYLEKKKSTSRQSSVHVKLKCRTAVKKLTMEQLDEINLRYPHIQRSGRIGSATHIVTQIQYGAEATFMFTKKLSETENEKDVNGQLKLGAEKFTKFLKGNANVGGKWADTNQENEDNIECHFQGDFELPSNVDRPTTYNEAIDFAQKFLKFSSDWMAKDDADITKSLGVPITVCLHPLVLMKDAQGAPALRYEISDTLASQCVLIMQNYGEVEDELRFMLEDQLVKMLSPLQKKLQLFQRCLTSFIAELKRKLGEMVVGIRSGKIKVEEFSQLISRISNEQFTFNYNLFEQWLHQKHKELCLIKRFQAEAKSKIKLENDVEIDEAKNKIKNQSKVLFFPSATTLQEEMTKFPVDFGYEISFSSLAHSELFLELLNETLGANFFNEISLRKNTVNLDLWCENNSVVERIQKEIVIFAELVNNKSKDEKFAFAMTAPDKYNEICANEFSIIFHHKQKRILGCDAAINVYQHTNNKKMIDIIRLLVEKIDEVWDPFPLLAFCEYYKKDNLIDIVRLLIDKKIDVNCKDDDGQNALHWVCRNYKNENLIDIVRLLIEKNIDVNCKELNYGMNALHWVCLNNQNENLIDIVRLLIGKNINVNCQTNYGWNALHLVCQRYKNENLIDIVRLLIEKNINVNCQTNYGWNALLLLCQNYHKDNLVDIVQLLLAKNVNVNCKDNDGWNALHYVCCSYKKENLIDIVRLLIEKNIDVNCKTNDGWNALLLLCRYCKEDNLIDIVRLLIEKNIDVNCKTNDGWNALHSVCFSYKKENLIDIVRLLIEKNIDVNCKTNYGRNALHFVCQYYDKDNLIDIVRLLIGKNIDVNCKQTDGWNALHIVCYYAPKTNLIALVSILVLHEIDKKVKTTGGEIRTARSLLLERFKEEEIADVLQMLDS